MLEVKLYLTLESENLTELGAKVVGVDTNLQKNYKLQKAWYSNICM